MAKSAVIGNIRVMMGLDSAQFQAGIADAGKSMDAMSRKVKAFGAALGAAMAGAVGAMSLAVRNVVKEADNLGNVADRLGVTAESLQRLRFAADQAGMGAGNLDTALRRFIRRSAEAAQGTGAAKKAFAELGIALRDSSGRLKDSDTLLREVADAMQRVQSPADRLRLAFAMFDTDGAAMVQILAKGSAGLDEFATKADRLGLVLDENTVRTLRAVKGNFDVIGLAMRGMANRIASMVAPALHAVSAGAAALSERLNRLVAILPVVAEYAAVAGGALAIMAAPSIVGAIGTLTVAVGRGLVGAIRLLTAAIAANPLGALAVGISAAVTAVYHFRDEIQKAIGVDVVAVVKRAGNIVINSFRAAFEDIRFIWNNFGNMLGAAVIGGVNIAIRAINGLLAAVSAGVDKVIEKLNKIPGVNIDPLGGSAQLSELANPFADALSAALEGHNARIQEIMASDPIGQIGQMFTFSTPAVQNMATALEGVNTGLEELGKGGGKLANAKKGIRDATTEMEHFASTLAGAMTNAVMGIVDGSRKAGEAVADLLRQLANLLMNQAFKMLFGAMFPGGGIHPGGLGYFPPPPRFALGTNHAPGGLALVGERGPELINLPRGSQVIPNHELGQIGEAQGGNTVVTVTLDPGLRGEILQEAQGQTVKLVRANNEARQRMWRNGGEPR